MELAQAERRRRVEPLHHPEIEEQVTYAGLHDEVTAGFHEPACEGEEQIALQAQCASDVAALLKERGVLQGALLVGAMTGHRQIVADIRRPAVAVGKEKGRYEQAENHARDDPLRGDQDEDGHDQGVLAEGEPEERVPVPLAKPPATEIDEKAG